MTAPSYRVALSFEDGVTRFITCESDQTVADASYRARINIPFDCRDGACGTCKAVCESGEFDPGDYLDEALSVEEAAEGYVLPCRMTPRSDLVLQIATTSAAAKTGAATHQGTVTGLDRLSPTTVALTVEIDDREALSFLPGQYVNIAVPGTDVHRAYSFSNAPEDKALTFLVKLIDGGAMSTYLAERAQVGDAISLTGPHGTFYLRESDSPLLLLAGGTGLAPILSILRTLEAAESDVPVRLVYGATTDDDVVELGTLNELAETIPGFTWQYCVADPDTKARNKGYVTALMGPEELHDGKAAVYLCGPPAMVEAVRAHIAELGIEPAGFHYEKFTPAAHPASAAGTGAAGTSQAVLTTQADLGAPVTAAGAAVAVTAAGLAGAAVAVAANGVATGQASASRLSAQVGGAGSASPAAAAAGSASPTAAAGSATPPAVAAASSAVTVHAPTPVGSRPAGLPGSRTAAATGLLLPTSGEGRSITGQQLLGAAEIAPLGSPAGGPPDTPWTLTGQQLVQPSGTGAPTGLATVEELVAAGVDDLLPAPGARSVTGQEMLPEAPIEQLVPVPAQAAAFQSEMARAAGRQPRFVSPDRFAGKVVLVTGAAQGIGEATARRIAAEGGTLVLADRAEQVRELADELAAGLAAAGSPGSTLAVTADLQTWEGAQGVVEAALRRYGRIDVAIHTVGGTIWAKPFEHYSPEEIRAEVDRSLWPTLWCCRAVAPHMIARGGGTIVNVSSVATRGLNRLPYAAAKGGVNAITSALALELAPHGIRVVATAPGGTDAPPRRIPRGPAPATAQERAWYQTIVDQSVDSSLLKRYGTLDEQAAALTFLASEEASYITGIVLPVSGGDLG